MQFVILLLGILLLLFLIIKVKLNTFVSLIATSILVALGLGMNPADIADSIKKRDWELNGRANYRLWVRRHDWTTGIRCRGILPDCPDVD